MTKKQSSGFFLNVVTNKNLQTLDMYQLTNVNGFELHHLKLCNNQWVDASATVYNRGYRFVISVPADVCVGAVLNSIRKLGKDWVDTCNAHNKCIISN